MINFNVVASFLIISLPLLTAFIAYKYQFYDRLSRPTKQAKLFLLLTIVTVIAGGFLAYNNFNDGRQLKAAQKELKDSVSAIANRLDLNKKETKIPLLNIYESPIFLQGNQDSIPIALSVKNYKQGVAKNLQLQIITLKQKHGEMIFNGFLPSDTNRYNLIPAGSIYSYFMNYRVRNINLNDSNLIYFRLSYTDEDGNLKEPLRGLYPIPFPKVGNPIFDATLQQFDKAKNLLSKIGLW